MTRWSPPASFDHYRIVRKLGRGGMGEVYLAHDTILDRPVAIKFITAAHTDVESRKRFLVEARAIARLQHPNVVTVFRVGEIDERPYLVSEYVPGRPLSALALPIPWTRALDIGLRLARALAAAHQRGVIHRDIKPGNVVLAEDGEPKLLDFGIAKLQGAEDAPSADQSLPAQDDSGGATTSASAVDAPWSRDRPGADEDETVDVDVVAQPRLAGRVTREGTVMGTLPYMAPEVLRGMPVSCAADVYSFGVMLFELCTGQMPRDSAQVEALRSGSSPEEPKRLWECVPGVDRRFSDIVARCLLQDPQSRFENGNELRAALSQLTPEARTGLIPEGNPYRGLQCFEAEHQALFFGRDSEIRNVLDRLLSDPIVLVAGDSGLGKSSLCRAGVLPRVAAWFGPERAWTTVVMVPGAHPVAALLDAFADLLADDAASVSQAIEDDPGCLARAVRKKLGATGGVVLLVDQMEELLTQSARNEGLLAGEVLGWLCEPSPCVRVVATARSDFLGGIATLPRVGDIASRSLYFLRPLSEHRIREAIVGPAHEKHVRFDPPALVDSLVSWSVQARGALPLLQFALAELWDARDTASDVITADLLDSMGGVGGALSRHGDAVMASLRPSTREAARRILIRLVTPDRTRARRAGSELFDLGPEASRAVQELTRARLVVAVESHDGTYYELAHEALVGGWTTLAGWLAATDGMRVMRERMARAAADWDRSGRRPHGLWNRTQLAELGGTPLDDLDERETSFLRSSRAAALRTRLARLGIVAAIPVFVAATWAALAIRSHRELDRRITALEQEARTHLQAAAELDHGAAKTRRDAFAAFDARDGDAGERAWSKARELDDKLAAEQGQAAQLLENALLLDPSRGAPRRLLAKALWDRALLAERTHDTVATNETIQRIALYDDGGAFRRAWSAPGTVRLNVDPPDATVTIELAPGKDAPRQALQPEEPSLGSFQLPVGSYVATVRARGRVPVAAPFVVHRGQTQQLTLTLPREGSVPEGFVYIPEGSFLFGSDAEESLRRSFYRTVPLHEVRTGAYLIARHETTYADWIGFLEALSPRARGARLPHVGRGGFQGALALEQLAGGRWKLSLQPAQAAYVALGGEPLMYRGRRERAAVDWSKLPVTGISSEDAEAFVGWLRASGRVPGARLCTEMEWERAARGADGRPWPSGDRLSAEDANIDETYGKSTEAMGPDEVGAHPSGRSVFGIDDMAGNAWEWVRSSLGEGYVARGGSFYYDANAARASNRELPEPSFRDTSLGLRVCADPPR